MGAAPYSSPALKFVKFSENDLNGPPPGAGRRRGARRTASGRLTARLLQRWTSTARATTTTTARAKKNASAVRATRSSSMSIAVM
jgi:hypothetical protein